MPLSQFNTVMPQAAKAVVDVTAALKHVRDSAGDLKIADLDRVQDGLRRAKETTIIALTEAQKAPGPAQQFMADLGGPPTLLEFQTKAGEIETKAAAWNTLLDGWLNGLNASDFYKLATVDVNGVQTKAILPVMFVDGVRSAPLRTSTELSDLIAVFEAVGG